MLSRKPNGIALAESSFIENGDLVRRTIGIRLREGCGHCRSGRLGCHVGQSHLALAFLLSKKALDSLLTLP